MKFTDYKLGFSVIGLIAFLIPMIPNIFWAILPQKSDYLAGANVARPVLDPIEKISQFIMIALMLFVINKGGAIVKGRTIIAALTIICLVIYLISWVVYFTGHISPVLIMGMAIVPSCYFILFNIWQRNCYATICGIIFAVAHTIISYLNYIKK